jgi:hypothetical protein
MVFADEVHGRLYVSDGAFPHRNVCRGHPTVANSGEIETQDAKAVHGGCPG